MMRLPALTADEMAELDRRLLLDFHFELLVLMENAGRLLAHKASGMLGSASGKRILVMAGKGNNGGGGLAGARHLHNWGASVDVVLSSDVGELKEAPAKQLAILNKMKVSVLQTFRTDASRYDLIVDALLGYSQKGDPQGTVAELVRLSNSSGRPVLCLDVPTGIDPNSGRPNIPAIRGTQTLTLALPKLGLLARQAKPYVGELYLADIGVPRQLYRQLGVRSLIFGHDCIIKVP